MPRHSIVILVLVAGGVALLDQSIKLFLKHQLSGPGEFSFLGGRLSLHLYPNRGIAFGIPLVGVWQVIFFVVVFVLLLYLYAKYLRHDRAWALAALGVIIGGAVGNIIDRIKWGYVIDYVDFRFFPIFNLADVCIVVGVLVLVWRILMAGRCSGENNGSHVSSGVLK
jgi:signal peptidase II